MCINVITTCTPHCNTMKTLAYTVTCYKTLQLMLKQHKCGKWLVLSHDSVISMGNNVSHTPSQHMHAHTSSVDTALPSLHSFSLRTPYGCC